MASRQSRSRNRFSGYLSTGPDQSPAHIAYECDGRQFADLRRLFLIYPRRCSAPHGGLDSHTPQQMAVSKALDTVQGILKHRHSG
jgi:hypothetical protein